MDHPPIEKLTSPAYQDCVLIAGGLAIATNKVSLARVPFASKGTGLVKRDVLSLARLRGASLEFAEDGALDVVQDGQATVAASQECCEFPEYRELIHQEPQTPVRLMITPRVLFRLVEALGVTDQPIILEYDAAANHEGTVQTAIRVTVAGMKDRDGLLMPCVPEDPVEIPTAQDVEDHAAQEEPVVRRRMRPT